MKRFLTTTAVAAAIGSAALAEPVQFDIEFGNHIDLGMSEQDVYVLRDGEDGQVYRVNADDKDMDQPLFATAEPVAHNPMDPSTDGPWPKGKELGVTLGEWLSAEGSGTYSCTDGNGHIDIAFDGLMPDGVYTMWHFFMAMPHPEPFIGTYDLPLGDRDGSQSVFVADADGKATFERSFAPCLQLGGAHLASGLGVAWHSDGKTYGALPGEFSTISHLQLFTFLPANVGM